MRSAPVKKQVFFLGSGSVLIFSLGLAIAGEFDAMLAWWFAIILLLPPLIFAFGTRYVSLMVICSVAFATQIITLPFFYLNREISYLGLMKPFEFTAWEAFPILVKVSLFLLALIVFFKLFYRFSFFRRALCKPSANWPESGATAISGQKSHYAQIRLSRNVRPWLCILLTILLITALVPINLWMFESGIGIVGVEPPKLDYKMSGILTYGTRYIVPLLLAFLYSQTRRGYVPMLILLMYSFFLGLTSVSRTAILLLMIPVFYLAWKDSRRLLMSIVFSGTIICTAIITLARDFVHIIINGKTVAKANYGFDEIVSKIILELDSRQAINEFFRTFIGIFERVDGFGNLVRSQSYNPNEVIGPLGFVLRMIAKDLAPLDIDLHHMQWQGYLLPQGFVNGGSLLSNEVILGNAGPWWIVFSAFVVAITLIICEKSIKSIIIHYSLPKELGVLILTLMCIIYFIETGASTVFTILFISLAIISRFPLRLNLITRN